MARVVAIAAGVLVLAAGIAAVYVYGQITSYDVTPVTGAVKMVSGTGGNVGVLGTDEGSVIVDTMSFRVQGRGLRELVEQLTGSPVRAIINTHYHWDHTHGNPAFPAGLRVVATARTRAYLEHFDAAYWEGEAAETLPNDTFEHEHELRIGGKTVRSVHVGRGHTGGDLAVLFVEDRVLHAGDLFFHDRYPNIDLEAGGSVKEWDATLDRVLELEFDHVIPGHGPVTDREGLRRFQRFLRELWGLAEEAARKGMPLDEFQRSAALDADAGYRAIHVPFFVTLDREFVLRRAWEEATGAVRPARVPRAGAGMGEDAS